jgi:signal transduction histidine kinase
MTPEETASVFERFYRAEGVRNARIPGIGLGLAIAKAIVEAHSGSIGCTSTPGAGTKFTVYIPHPPGPLDGLEAESAFVPAGGRETQEERHG